VLGDGGVHGCECTDGPTDRVFCCGL
jgi:hypothetical protein